MGFSWSRLKVRTLDSAIDLIGVLCFPSLPTLRHELTVGCDARLCTSSLSSPPGANQLEFVAVTEQGCRRATGRPADRQAVAGAEHPVMIRRFRCVRADSAGKRTMIGAPCGLSGRALFP